jgi:hypothetical protein
VSLKLLGSPRSQVLPWLEGSVQGVTHVGIFTLTTFVALTLYLCSVFTDPGRHGRARAWLGLGGARDS